MTIDNNVQIVYAIAPSGTGKVRDILSLSFKKYFIYILIIPRVFAFPYSNTNIINCNDLPSIYHRCTVSLHIFPYPYYITISHLQVTIFKLYMAINTLMVTCQLRTVTSPSIMI